MKDNLENDWRLQGQEKYLLGVHLSKKEYQKYSDEWDHEHCEFCYVKFSATIPSSLREGYATDDNYRWICETCFNDFKIKFNWKIDSTKQQIED